MMSVKESIPDECQELQEENDVLTQENKALNEENKKLKECWIKCQNCTNEMCFANEKLEIGYKAMKNSYIAQIKKLKEENSATMDSPIHPTWIQNKKLEQAIKELKKENDKLKLSEEEKRLLKNIWIVADGTGFPSVQPMSNARLIEKLT